MAQHWAAADFGRSAKDPVIAMEVYTTALMAINDSLRGWPCPPESAVKRPEVARVAGAVAVVIYIRVHDFALRG